MAKMSFTNKQSALEYAFYMIASSYFDAAVCWTEFTERNLLVQYKEQKLNEQYWLEEICNRYMTSLVKRLPEDVFHQTADVYLVRKSGSEQMRIIFRTFRQELVFTCSYVGKKPHFDLEMKHLSVL